jgi:hypothetical protein
MSPKIIGQPKAYKPTCCFTSITFNSCGLYLHCYGKFLGVILRTNKFQNGVINNVGTHARSTLDRPHYSH